MLQPVDRAGDQEATHLVAPEIVYCRVPVAVQTLARIFVLVQSGSIEAIQPMRVGGKMRRHPVDNHSDAGLMGTIDELREALGPAKPRGRSKQAKRLVAPRSAERMLGDGHELDVREAEIRDIRQQTVRQ